MYHAKSNVKNFSLYWGEVSLDKKFFSVLNMHQAKSGVKIFSLYWDWVPPPKNLRPGTPQKIWDLGPLPPKSETWDPPPKIWDLELPPKIWDLGPPQKIWDPGPLPPKSETWEPPQKIWDLAPPKNLRPGTPPENLRLGTPPENLRPGTPPPVQGWIGYPPLNVNRLKLLPSPILRMAGGNNTGLLRTSMVQSHCSKRHV